MAKLTTEDEYEAARLRLENLLSNASDKQQEIDSLVIDIAAYERERFVTRREPLRP